MIRYIITSLPMLVCLFWSVRLWIDWREQRSMAKWRLLVFSVVATVLYAGHFAYFNSMEAILPYTETLYSMANLAVFPLYYLYLLGGEVEPPLAGDAPDAVARHRNTDWGMLRLCGRWRERTPPFHCAYGGKIHFCYTGGDSVVEGL